MNLREEDLLNSVKDYLAKAGGEVLALHQQRRPSCEALLARTRAIDDLLISLYKFVEEQHRRTFGDKKLKSVLIAQGGYGRRELCLHSDIDLLFLYEGRANEFIKLLTEKVVQTLWDAGLEVGCATRTVKDCRRLMEEDLTIASALIDARHLAGDMELHSKFEKTISGFFSSKGHQFYQKKLKENEERRLRYGDSIYLLEPNLKEGMGGLRDYHTLYWMARMSGSIKGPLDLLGRQVLSGEEFERLWEALQFLWLVRNELHRLSGKRFDQLTFDHQKQIAGWLGYRDTGAFLGVELFMQKYYTEAACIQRLSDKALRRLTRRPPTLFPPPGTPMQDDKFLILEGRLTVPSKELLEERPLILLKIFDLARELKVEIDDLTRERIEKMAIREDGFWQKFRADPESGAFFRKILRRSEGLGALLVKMNETGVLGAFLPEFKKLHFRAQHDIYHVYTVDVHSLFAVGELEKLIRGDYASSHPTLSELVQDVDRRDLLAFAILYHDIGKGEGKGHVEKGSPLIREAGGRLGFSPEEIDLLEFLERSHLIMTHLAFRRDLEDQNLIIQFARAMPSMDHLNRLCVLTFCDVKGVGPEAMTDWKATLLDYLYLKTREVIRKGSFTKEKASTLIPKVQEEVLTLLATGEERKRGGEFFSIMSPRYLLATAPASIVRHLGLWKRFSQDPIVFEWRVLEREALNEVTLLTHETPALFSRMTGLFAAHNINILDAQLTRSRQGHALQVFRVTDAEGKPIADPDQWGRVEKDLRSVLEGRVSIDKLVEEKFRPSLFKKKVAQILPTKVVIDNDVSPFYTVIDVYTHDRLGLLYQITSTLAALGLYVDVSKISTKVDQVADTFYVKDIFGHKITSEVRLKKIQEVLKKVIEEEPTPAWRPPA